MRQFKKLFRQSGSRHDEQVELSSVDFAEPHPIEDLYQDSRQPHRLSWIIPGKLAVGGLPQPGDGAILAREKIKVVLSLCAQSEGTLPDEIGQNLRCLRFILPDSHYILGLQPNQLERVVELIHDHIQSQQPIYVHCLAGMERSPPPALPTSVCTTIWNFGKRSTA
ncbi:MAG: dual specificity protein phosphatase family protein, partial [Leptolyngbyaceae cyanobacterium SM1_4_3]|nr:dual specificity protein phosphatase family protein [Leptolyngbyaceae cyanobacterium SM1_4_3]